MLPTVVIAFGVTVAALQAAKLESLPKGPYAKLFQIVPGPSGQPGAGKPPRVVCGMTLIPADPNVDPRIRVVVPSTPEHKIRAVPPPICVE